MTYFLAIIPSWLFVDEMGFEMVFNWRKCNTRHLSSNASKCEIIIQRAFPKRRDNRTWKYCQGHHQAASRLYSYIYVKSRRRIAKQIIISKVSAYMHSTGPFFLTLVEFIKSIIGAVPVPSTQWRAREKPHSSFQKACGQKNVIRCKPVMSTKINAHFRQGWQGVAKAVFATGFNRFKPADRSPLVAETCRSWQKLTWRLCWFSG